MEKILFLLVALLLMIIYLLLSTVKQLKLLIDVMFKAQQHATELHFKGIQLIHNEKNESQPINSKKL